MALPPIPGGGGASAMMLLSDGTVMAQIDGGASFYRLVPATDGSYINGTWRNDITSMSYTRTYFASAVLQNGKVFFAGGELGSGSNYVEIYDPVSNSWITLGPAYFGGLADANCAVLGNGQVLVCPQAPSGFYQNQTFLFDPANNQFSATLAGPLNGILESTWVKMPGGNILTVDSANSYYGAYTAEQYVPGTGAWSSTLSLPVSVWVPLPVGRVVAETGPALLLPNGNAIFFGGSGHTAIYQTSSQTWIQGPDIPSGLVAADTPGAMMVNGIILLAVGPPLQDNPDPNNPSDWASSTSFYEYDYSSGPVGAFRPQIHAPGGGFTRASRTYSCRMLALPDGTILFTDGGNQLYVYQPDPAPIAAGKPTISTIVANNVRVSYHLSGTKLNGISGGASYGDDAQMDSNYPLVRMTNSVTRNVYYARTYNWSSTDVQTGNTVVTTEFTLPLLAWQNPGAYSLVVVANGNPSDPVSFTVPTPTWVDFNYTGFQNGSYQNPFATMGQGTNAVPSGGTIVLKGPAINANHSTATTHELMTIRKAMTVTALGGSASIGR
jgi:hypothetical protein